MSLRLWEKIVNAAIQGKLRLGRNASIVGDGNVNIIPNSAGNANATPGEVQINANSQLMSFDIELSATDATKVVVVCTRAMRFKAISAAFTTASTSGTLQVEKLTGTTAPGSGTVLLTGTMSLAGTANTVVSGTPITTVASITCAAGDRVGIVIAGTMTGLAGGIGTIMFAPI